MADPIQPEAPATAASQPQPETELDKRYKEAGYARNRAELNYKNVVKEHGEDSEEAKAAHNVLNKAQEEVEKIQKEFQRPKKAPKALPTPAPKPTETKPEPKKLIESLPKLIRNFEESQKKVFLYETRSSEMIMLNRDLTRFSDPKKLEEFLNRFLDEASKKKNQNIEPPTNQLRVLERSPGNS
jgi:hypothetical protein